MRRPPLPASEAPDDERPGDRPLGRIPNLAPQISKVAKALAHPLRVRILEALARNEATAYADLVRMMKVSQSTFSTHLKILKSAGLVSAERPQHGPASCAIDRPAFMRLRLLLGQLTREPPDHRYPRPGTR